ncbi:MAG: MBL fold metallo-hydrolase [Patescibacteria group bacterium]|nr:MBL fold metallo-hydrolase [Patescibacteria group bacterium]
MIVTFLGNEKFEFKTKNGNIVVDNFVKINDQQITDSGEYEIAGVEVEIMGNIKIVRAEGMAIGYLYNCQKTLSEEELGFLSNIDILLIPVGGEEVFSAKEAMEAVSNIEPRIVIPMHYQDLTEFCKGEGNCGEPIDSLKITKDKLLQEERQIVVLNAQQ